MAALAGVGLATLFVLGACGALERAAHEDDRAFGAQHLGDPYGEHALADVLSPEQREAADRVGIRVGEPELGSDGEVDGRSGNLEGEESTSDTAGRVGVTALSVGMTLGMLVAPFFLY